MALSILKNERTRLAFRFGRQSALRTTNDVVDQLQAQLEAERKQHRLLVQALGREPKCTLRTP